MRRWGWGDSGTLEGGKRRGIGGEGRIGEEGRAW